MLGILHLVFADILVGGDARECLHLAIERTGAHRQTAGYQVNIHIAADILGDELVQLVEEFLINLAERLLNCSFFCDKSVSFDS